MSTSIERQPIRILLVEDNEGDILLTKEAFADVNLRHHLSVARDGQEGLDFLQKVGKHADAPTPDLILLDLNMPRMKGTELLKIIKNDEKLQSIPVVVLSTSGADRDVSECYQLRANGYIKKPVDFDQFMQVADTIKRFWVDTVQLPPNDHN